MFSKRILLENCGKTFLIFYFKESEVQTQHSLFDIMPLENDLSVLTTSLEYVGLGLIKIFW